MASTPGTNLPGFIDPPPAPVFREVQHFRQWWLFALVLALAGLAWAGFVSQILLGRPFSFRPTPDYAMWLLTVIVGMGLPAFFFVVRLVTEVRPESLYVRLVPLRGRLLELSDITKAEAVTYRPIRDFGGWGVRWAGSRGVAYNAYGNRGVQLVLKDGRRVLLGSQQPEQLLGTILSANKFISDKYR